MKISQCRRLSQASMMVSMLTAVAVAPALGADASQEPVFMEPGAIKWQDAPPDLPKGAKIAVLYGDPSKEGPFVIRLRAPAGYKIPPHWHSQVENLTIISGAFHFGSGDKPNAAGEHVMKAGAYHYLPAKSHHYAYAKEATVVQVHGNGPFDIHYVNEAEAPKKSSPQ